MSEKSQPSRPPSGLAGYLSEDTICAVSTAVGGAISIVRISGPRACASVLSLFGRENGAEVPPPRLFKKTVLYSLADEKIDSAGVLFFKGPESYTGEDLIEFHLHGNAYIVARVFEELLGAGVRAALPGEFTFRALRNGKMDLTQVGALSDLMEASNASALDGAVEKLGGLQKHWVLEVGEKIRKLTAFSELGIDFSDQEIDSLALKKLKAEAQEIRNQIQEIANSFDRGQKIQDGIALAIVGLPNAGKSSLFNELLGEDRAIVSDLPGTTRDVLRERLTLEGGGCSVSVKVLDTAGIRNTDEAIEKIGVDRAMEAAKQADLVVFVVDPGQALSANADLWNRLGRSPQSVLGVMTKADLYSSDQKRLHQEQLEKETGIVHWESVSSKNHLGIKELGSAIAKKAAEGIKKGQSQTPFFITRLEQKESLEVAAECLSRALMAPEYEFFAADLRHALHALRSLIGETTAEDVLSRIFSQFCIGK